MDIRQTALPGVVVVESPVVADARGAFQRCFCSRDLAPLLGTREIAQINRSLTARSGTVRGLHFQFPPHAEMKLIRCLRGRVWDVAVDLRAGSPQLLRWHAEELSAANGRMLVIPEGVAHGFQALENDSELLYIHTAHYAHAAEGGVRCDDPQLGIDWPMMVGGLSDRDRALPMLPALFTGFPQ
ncbi:MULTISPECIES: dTDP-4-dehydrorhamnose 3,5-epimerase family protein [Acidiphilium]|jgi:dTDP-4-dehydrorhamnose 3,5-epimerase|uniref:dTDP-4-dehydrorhamnose 3,5-epimerase n=1 Tax=Acidiphilium multivorum (strain DSM 11245 / JCM 8867 / NBRC 100883 / AIU 301) TaxID=926570 RepID=F0J4G3_ACIMA|nr:MULTISPECIES: dTDP-4-dehydrorhamnose 3,5-epimerase [Acidiphilium]MBS3025096.1 dTDP-4-dehydrorhamnose 3,5-epimerase family protein [Acidiphilium multivorum]BAJ80015.1 dTDP-4-dehydrorhamnose 3,5-epimerase [Acidiphilium multivorum AIU301]GAN73875.1 dTDP-4-dehydrorhamnose 3,5-epimerase [Acidiphilium multivorum AIU301]